MSGLAEKSMIAPPRKADDIPVVNPKPVSVSPKPKQFTERTVSTGYSPWQIQQEPPKPKPIAQKKDIKFDLEKIKKGVRVKHKSFGEGVVISVKGNMVKVKFDKDNIEKQFAMAMSFANGFLTIM